MLDNINSKCVILAANRNTHKKTGYAWPDRKRRFDPIALTQKPASALSHRNLLTVILLINRHEIKTLFPLFGRIRFEMKVKRGLQCRK